MHPLLYEDLIWMIGCILYGLLVVALFARRSFRSAPMFTAWITEAFLQSTLLFVLSRFNNGRLYNFTYWTFAVVEIALQVAVAVEFADQALRYGNTWVSRAKSSFVRGAVFVLMLSFVAALQAKPAVVRVPDVVYTRLEVFTSVFVFLLSTLTLTIAYRCGSLWKPQDFQRFTGFVVWSAASSVVDTLHIYWRMIDYFSVLENVHLAIGGAVVLYWIITAVGSQSVPAHKELREVELLASLYKAG